ncbi:MAG TPA: FHA domain-containing protein, partial [Ideonella sp.]|nr:FHA domain-containing protein [Ideonella sp.]
MITLTVLSFNGQAADAPLSASFDELGGSIGRADTNQLVLPDPERSISRVHAQVVFRNGGYAVIDRGSNPISVNGKPVGNGREVPLPDGAQLQIGGYLLGVQQAAGGAAR